MHQRNGRILIIDRNEDVLFALRIVLKAHVAILKTESNLAHVDSLLDSETFDVILIDINLCNHSTKENENYAYLKKIIHLAPNSSILLITPYNNIEKSMVGLEMGAKNFILKPWQNEKLLATVLSAIELSHLRNEVNGLKEKQQGLHRIMDKPFAKLLGTSKAMQNTMVIINDIAPTAHKVLIVGEKGTEKELIAKEIHKKSSRKNEAFIRLDLNTIALDKVDVELFGNMQKTNNNVQNNILGRLELADKGTLFIDEINKLSIPLQQKLGTVLQNNAGTNEAEGKLENLDVRLICAHTIEANDIDKAMEHITAHIDPLSFTKITVPPLRQRMEDIPALAEHFLSIFSRNYNKVAKLSTGALNKLVHYEWPGNVQELRLILRNAIFFSENQIIDENLFKLKPSDYNENSCEINTSNLEDIEKYMIKKTLHQNQSNISKTALQLGLTRTSLYRRIEKHGLQEF